jgi:hypothetical protein
MRSTKGYLREKNRTHNTTEDRIRLATEDKQKSEKVRSEVSVLYGAVTVTFRAL